MIIIWLYHIKYIVVKLIVSVLLFRMWLPEDFELPMWLALLSLLIVLSRTLPEWFGGKLLSTTEMSVVNSTLPIYSGAWKCFCLHPILTCWPSTAVEGRTWVSISTKHFPTSLEKMHSLGRNTPKKPAGLRAPRAKGCSILGLTISIRGDPFICKFLSYIELPECAYFLGNWFTYYYLAENLCDIFFLEKFLEWQMKWTFLFPLFT